jgi:hypothetical protein
MCGRFTITHPNEALAALFDAVPGNDLPVTRKFNVCPTNSAARPFAERVAITCSDDWPKRLAQGQEHHGALPGAVIRSIRWALGSAGHGMAWA